MNGKNKNPLSGSASLSAYHLPVLLNEFIDHLEIDPEGIYVDCTYGGGGHSKAILEKLGSKGKLVAFDQDEDAKRNLIEDERLIFIPNNFRYLQRFLRLHGIAKVNGILADLGVSSHQFDEKERGFSTRFNADMDMRMDQRQQKTAFDILNNNSEEQLHKLFEKYGEVSNSRTLAKTIVELRNNADLKSIDGFKNSVRAIVKGNPNKYFAQVFQALRIEVNDEMGALKELLEQIPDTLERGGRVAVITFHSLEDRLVKVFFRDGTFEIKDNNPFEKHQEKPKPLKAINKKPIKASAEEVRKNPRSRSAKLRVAERT
jgi:16S rRNA (cytosine1402-N4)-methyltransferase